MSDERDTIPAPPPVDTIDPMAVFERENLADAVRSVAAVLEVGRGKHGVVGWRDRGVEVHAVKVFGHMHQLGCDEESGQPHTAHAVTRLLMILQLEIELTAASRDRSDQ